jgi:hypothetical protein
MKRLWILSILIIFTAYFAPKGYGQHSPELSQAPIPENKIVISGKSNLSTFNIYIQFQHNTNVDAKTDTSCIIRNDKVLVLPVKNFRYSNPMMKNDFYHLVNANEYPNIKIYYSPSLLKSPKPGAHNTFDFTVQIQQVCRTYEVPVEYVKTKENLHEVSGSFNILLSDFKLKPKRYFFGLIRLKNRLKIDFYLYF